MKQKDIALIVVVVFISGIVSLFVSKALFAKPANQKKSVEVVEAINPNFPTPNKTYFNNQSIDPTQLIHIGAANNANPFNSSQQ